MLRTHNSTGRRLNPEERRRSKDGKYNRRTLADFEHGCFLPCVIQTRGRLRCVLRCGPCAFGASSTLRLLLWPNPPIIFSIGGTLPWVKVPPSSSFSVLPCLFLPLPFSLFLRLAVSSCFCILCTTIALVGHLPSHIKLHVCSSETLPTRCRKPRSVKGPQCQGGGCCKPLRGGPLSRLRQRCESTVVTQLNPSRASCVTTVPTHYLL